MTFILLTGAPESESLSWDDTSLCAPLLAAFDRPMDAEARQEMEHPGSQESARLAGLRQRLGTSPEDQPEPLPGGSPTAPGEHIESSHGRTSGTGAGACDTRIDSSQLQAAPSTPRADGRFLEHSLGVYSETRSSQVFPVDSFESRSTEAGLSSFETSSLDSSAPSRRWPLAIPASLQALDIPLTLLGNLPDHSSLLSSQPSTITANVVVAVVARPLSPRTVCSRRGSGRPTALDLLELVVGDASRAGFRLCLWLGQSASSGAMSRKSNEASFIEAASRIRRGDVVVFRNLALSSWKGEVYGQSLRRGLTKIDVLAQPYGDRHSLVTGNQDPTQVPLNSRLSDYASAVQDWLFNFVPPAADHSSTDRSSQLAKRHRGDSPGSQRRPPSAKARRLLLLPPDSQD